MSKQPAPQIIAEIGCNHRGELETAKEMIKIAAQFCKVDVVKFQKRNSRELLTEEEYNAPHPNPANAYGKTYGEHREFLEFDAAQHAELKHCCEEWRVTYSTSVWDVKCMGNCFRRGFQQGIIIAARTQRRLWPCSSALCQPKPCLWYA